MRESARRQRGTVGLVFCGGKGTRMQPITSLMRKEMLPMGPQRKPLLDHVVDHLKSHGIREIVFLGSDRKGGDVANYFGNGRRFGVRATHQSDPPRCGGTGHVLLWAIRRLGLKERELLVYYGDIFNAVDLKELLETHRKKGAAATLVMSEDYILPKGMAHVTPGGMVSAFEEKPRWRGPEKIAVGLLCLDAERVVKACGGLPSTVQQLQRSRWKDLMADIIRHLATRHEVAAYTTKASWRDVGSFQDYLAIQDEFVKVAGRAVRTSPTEPGLSVFLSYHISRENREIVDDLLAPCLSSAGYGVVSGSKLNRARGTYGPPSQRARQLINTCDILAAVATPVGRDRKPSMYVVDEVSYADGKGKTVLLFVEKGTSVPAHWNSQFTWTPFERARAGALIRDVLEMVGGSE